MIEELIINKTKFIDVPYQSYSVKKITNVINIDKRTVQHWNSWYNINNNWYYFKKTLTSYTFFNELIGVELANHFSLDTVSYIIGRQKTDISSYNPFFEEFPTYTYGLLSENFRKDDLEYFTPSALGANLCNDLEILDILKCETLENYNELLKKIVKLTVLDFYMQQADRNESNLLFTRNRNGYIDLAPIYDYEYSYRYLDVDYKSSLLRMNLDNNKTLNYVQNNELFQQEFNKIIDINIDEIIEKIKDEYNLELFKGLTDIYIDHDKRIKKLIKEYKLVK